MNPKHQTLLNQAQALSRAGKAQEASTAYRAFLDRAPRHADAWADYAGQLLKLGKMEEAQEACAAAIAIDPKHCSARINLGSIQMRRNHLDAAETQFRSVLKLDPGRMDAQLGLAHCLIFKPDLEMAREALELASRPGALRGSYSSLLPHLGELWAIFSSALFAVHRFEEAEEACHTALQISPGNSHAKSLIGSIRMAEGNLDEAERLFRQLVNDHPGEELARRLLITCLSRKGELESADLEIADLIRQEPKSQAVHDSLMGTYYNLGRWREYVTELERFRKVDPASAHPDWEQGLVDLLFGRMPQGWERYEARLRLPPESKPRRTFAQPAWQGGSFAGKTLLLWAEQGLGDTLMFLRYLPLVKALGGQVILDCQPPLMDVAATCQGVDIVIPWHRPVLPFDLQASLMSLPWIFRTELSSIPAQVPYLNVPEEIPHRQAILEQLNQAQDTTRIGLVWAGTPGHGRDFERSLPVASLAPLAVLPGVTWFSFQLGREEIPPLPGLISLAPLLGSFSDTAFALTGMDLVITVDTAMAHLAGALGVPTLLLLSFQPDFRWLLDRDDSPWYPTLRLYRQPAYGDWASVLRQVVADLMQDD